MLGAPLARSGGCWRRVSGRQAARAFVRRARGIARVRAVLPERAFYRSRRVCRETMVAGATIRDMPG
ncbi:hypothetical protein R69658_06232 [Paraburkholderia aspalathi]|uniref:Uncharacterized protein n=1 Tax=Paraburkholderia aspalathi TaxID=1324617 RepID=A0ABN7MWH4_9BURK|nr:hypothetical protein R69658_06232 [Paraburkholderia aspalathi]